jgi:hypothetical protein
MCMRLRVGMRGFRPFCNPALGPEDKAEHSNFLDQSWIDTRYQGHREVLWISQIPTTPPGLIAQDLVSASMWHTGGVKWQPTGSACTPDHWHQSRHLCSHSGELGRLIRVGPAYFHPMAPRA